MMEEFMLLSQMEQPLVEAFTFLVVLPLMEGMYVLVILMETVTMTLLPLKLLLQVSMLIHL